VRIAPFEPVDAPQSSQSEMASAWDPLAKRNEFALQAACSVFRNIATVLVGVLPLDGEASGDFKTRAVSEGMHRRSRAERIRDRFELLHSNRWTRPSHRRAKWQVRGIPWRSVMNLRCRLPAQSSGISLRCWWGYCLWTAKPLATSRPGR